MVEIPLIGDIDEPSVKTLLAGASLIAASQ
jgi:hypothetical protein